MKPAVKQWVEKAEADFGSAAKEMRSRKSLNYDLVCSLSQQCIEKYLKAMHQQQGLIFGKTHNLPYLLNFLTDNYPQLEMWRPQMERLSIYAVIFRYPGESADKETARQTLNWCKSIRKVVRDALGMVEERDGNL